MHRLQELVRLHREGVSERDVCKRLAMGRNTARRYGAAFRAAGLLEGPADTLPELDALRAAVAAAMPPRTSPQEQSSVAAWGDEIERLFEGEATPKAIYDFLKREREGFAGSYDAVKRACRRLRRARGVRAQDVAIRVETTPGQVAQVDFFFVGRLYDPELNKKRKAWAFVMVLGFSRHMFVDVVFDQSIGSWLRLHMAAFAFFGGVPAVIVPDNLKAAVIRAAFNSSGEIALNRSYVALARHYGFQIDPTPAFAPEKKGKVERAGQYFRRNYMRTRSGDDIESVRAGITRWILETAGTRVHGTTGQRPVELFEKMERAALKPLPRTPFEPVIWHQAKVHVDSFVQFQKHLYSVPWRLIGTRVWIRATDVSVIVYADDDERVATHRRGPPNARTYESSHFPPDREQWRFRDRAYWEARAAELGEDVLTYVADLFEADDVLLQLRTVQAIVSFLKRYPPDRCNAACRRARFYGVTRVRVFKDILRKDLDLEALPAPLVHGVLEAPQYARKPSNFIHPSTEA